MTVTHWWGRASAVPCTWGSGFLEGPLLGDPGLLSSRDC